MTKLQETQLSQVDDDVSRSYSPALAIIFMSSELSKIRLHDARPRHAWLINRPITTHSGPI